MAGTSSTAGSVHGPRIHDIGVGGVVSVSVEADDVRIRGVDGTEARLVTPAETGGLEMHATPGRLAVRTAAAARGGFLGLRIGPWGFGARAVGTVELEVPHDARVEVTSAAGDVTVRDIRGGAQLRTISGDVSVAGAAGRIAVDVASGDVTVAGAEPLSLDVRSVSGDVLARGPRFERVAVETISGDIALEGAFVASAAHAISTVSGTVDLAVLDGLTVELKTVSGTVDCRHPDRREGDGRQRPLVIGDGAARLGIRSMSGDVEVRAGGAGEAETSGDGRDAPGTGLAGFATPPSSAAGPGDAPPTWPAAPAAGASETSAATLAILESLARGEIDVAEAERRLAGEAWTPEAAPDA